MGNKASKNTVNLDTASRLDVICRRGDTFTLVLDFNEGMPGDGWRMEVRENDTDDSGSPTIASTDFSFVVGAGAVDSSKLTITATSSTMAAVNSGLYVYDLQNTSNGVVKTYLYGTFKINEDVTIA